MTDFARILNAIEQGDTQAASQILPLVYDELRKLAANLLSSENPDQTLQPTALVHEAYLRLAGVDAKRHWNSCGHFLAASAEAMRRILVDNARRKRSQKRGGGLKRRELADLSQGIPNRADDVLALDEALDKLAAEDMQKAELVKLRYFAGMTIEEAAKHLGISPSTAKRHWTYARAWLHREIVGDAPVSGS